jgi:hypothetical protein
MPGERNSEAFGSRPSLLARAFGSRAVAGGNAQVGTASVMTSHGEVSNMKRFSDALMIQSLVQDRLLWMAGLLIGTAFLWPLLFAAYLWAVYMGRL